MKADMASTNPRMSNSYKAIFALSIMMIFVVILGGRGAKSSGFGVWVWGYTVWLMYKRNNQGLVSLQKTLLWIDGIAIAIGGYFLVVSDADVESMVGVSATGILTLGAISTAITYGLLTYFKGQLANQRVFESSPVYGASPLSIAAGHNTTNSEHIRNEPSTNLSADDDAFYERVAEELDEGNTDRGLWTRLYAECDGDEKKTRVLYIKRRVQTLIAAETVNRQQNTDGKDSAIEADTKVINGDLQEQHQESTLRESSGNHATAAEEALAQKRASRKVGWYIHCVIYVVVSVGLALLSVYTGRHPAIIPPAVWGLALLIHGIVVFVAQPGNNLRERLLDRERKRLQG